jgi:hypothetical protein
MTTAVSTVLASATASSISWSALKARKAPMRIPVMAKGVESPVASSAGTWGSCRMRTEYCY